MEAVAERILAVERPHPVRVAIDGCSAAGKTTFADGLADSLARLSSRPVLRVGIDYFKRAVSLRTAYPKDSPESYYLDSSTPAQPCPENVAIATETGNASSAVSRKRCYCVVSGNRQHPAQLLLAISAVMATCSASAELAASRQAWPSASRPPAQVGPGGQKSGRNG